MNRVKELREDRDFKQKELAYHLNITRSKYSNIENNITPLTIDIAIDLVIFYKVSLYYILGYSDDKAISKEQLDKIIMRKENKSN